MAITRIITRQYPTMRDAIMEMVQNALDAKARNIWIVFDSKRRTLAVRDDGSGVGQVVMNQRLARICQSGKSDSDLGEFGIGIVAPLDKGEKYTFTSSARIPNRELGEDGGYYRWTFELAAIKDEAEFRVPCDRLGQMMFDASGDGRDGRVPWRTEALVEKIFSDSVRNDIDPSDLRYQIQSRFSGSMRKSGTAVHLTIIRKIGGVEESHVEDFGARAFDGEPLPVWKYHDAVVGSVAVRLHLRRVATGRRQQIRLEVGERGRDFRITFSQFMASANSLLSDDVIGVLNSGTFEGEITGENIKVMPNRHELEKDETLRHLCLALEKWYSEVGKETVQTQHESREDARWQELGVNALKFVELLLKNPAFGDWRRAVRSFHEGTVSTGHTAPSRRSVIGDQVLTSVRANASSTGTSRSGQSGEGHTRAEPKNERTEDIPLTVTGPLGQKRTVVKSGSFGLQILFDRMPGGRDLWSLDPNTGQLRINVRHPYWAECEATDTDLFELQLRIIEHALTWCVAPEDWRPQLLMSLEESMRCYMFFRLCKKEAKKDRVSRSRATKTKKK